MVIVALANRRHGFVYSGRGFDPATALRCLRSDAPLSDLDAAERWSTALDGLHAVEADIVVEVSQSPHDDGEPGLSHIRAALSHGSAVATSNKWPVALAGVELAELARGQGVGFRAESTVMSGTPVLAALSDGLAGATPRRAYGLVNATTNYICSRISEGASYEAALYEAQERGLAEPDPAQDVDGLDSVAKVMIVSALIFGRQLTASQVRRRGIATVPPEEIYAMVAQEQRPREVARIDPASELYEVDVRGVESGDPLFGVHGPENILICDVDPIGAVAVRGPGAGAEIAGQGVLNDLIWTAREAVNRLRR